MNREVEDGMGFSGLVPTREEREIDRLRSELAAARKWNQDLLDAARETRPDDDRRAAEWGLAVFADLKEERAANAANIAYAKNIGKELAEAKAALECADAKSDAEMERVKACEHIADGDEGWEKVRNLCPSTAAVARLQDRMKAANARIAELEPLEHSFETILEAKCLEVSQRLISRAEKDEAEIKLLKEHVVRHQRA